MIPITHDRDEVFRNDLIKTSQQIPDLFFNRREETVLRRQLDEFSLVLLSDRYGLATLLERGDAT
jgi:hypothetical protein